MSTYRIELEPDDNGTFLITCPLLPEVTTFTEDRMQWQNPARQAVSESLAARIANGQDAPTENATGTEYALVMPLLLSLKVDLYNAMRAAKVSKAELGRRLGIHPPQVDRLLDLSHASQLEALSKAFFALGYVVDVSVRPTRAA